MSNRIFFLSKVRIDWALIILTSLLLGIWATKGTIALRNILLILGMLTSICILYNFHQSRLKINILNLIPILFILIFFSWVIIHYLILSSHSVIQLEELKSTWLRSLLASIVGFGVGLCISNKPKLLVILCFGMIISYIVLICQNLFFDKSIISQTYIYSGKINAVLIGNILLAISTALIIADFINIKIKDLVMLQIGCIAILIIVLYVYVYILDTRNGMIFSVLIVCIAVCKQIIKIIKYKSILLSARFESYKIISIFLIILLVLNFAIEQVKLNPGWKTTISDVRISLQVDNYLNWRNPDVFGYPNGPDGQWVKSNTYERISWAVVGIKILAMENILGLGILNRPFGILINQKFPDSGTYINSTHSGWIDLLLAFGFPGILFIFGCLLSSLYLSLKSDGFLNVVAANLSICILITYGIGELSNDHAIEILFFFMSFLSSLQIYSKIKKI